jgi:uncharacterized protein
MMPFSPKPLMSSSPRPCGLSKAHRIALGAVTFVPDHSGALYCPEFRTLLVADLHLEHGVSLARRGIHVPPFDTTATLATLHRVIAETRPWRLIMMGDSFHDEIAHAHLTPQHRQQLQSLTSSVETIWITGNHDPAPPEGLGGVTVSSHLLGSIALNHIPTRKLKSAFEIAGHLHPGACVVQRGIHVRSKSFVADQRRIIMPAFGAYTGALNVRSDAFAGLLDQDTAHAWLIGRTGIHKIAYRKLA